MDLVPTPTQPEATPTEPQPQVTVTETVTVSASPAVVTETVTPPVTSPSPVPAKTVTETASPTATPTVTQTVKETVTATTTVTASAAPVPAATNGPAVAPPTLSIVPGVSGTPTESPTIDLPQVAPPKTGAASTSTVPPGWSPKPEAQMMSGGVGFLASIAALLIVVMIAAWIGVKIRSSKAKALKP